MNKRVLLHTISAVIFSSLCFGSVEATGTVIVGGQFGDEGKGKVVDYLAAESDIIVRSQGGNNAGHTVIIGESEFKLNLIPSGILTPACACYISGGVVIDPKALLMEIDKLEKSGICVKGRLWISPYANVIMPYHRQLDVAAEKSKGSAAIGTTGRGIGPCYTDRTNRCAIRIGDMMSSEKFMQLMNKNAPSINRQLTQMYNESEMNMSDIIAEYCQYAQELAPYVKEDMEYDLALQLKQGKKVLFEGAQGTFLDNTFGTLPYVTSSNTTSAGILAGAGVGPSQIDETLIVIKAYMTRVGNGPLPTECSEEDSFMDAKEAREYGTVTGRKRRMGWFDAVLARQSVRLNGADCVALMKLDILDRAEAIKICIGYEVNGQVWDHIPGMMDLGSVTPVYETMPGWQCSTVDVRCFEALPANAQAYVKRIAELIEAPIKMISVGPERSQTILM